MKKIRTHYDNLQVAETASLEVIKGAYKYLSQRWHPDKNPDQREHAERITRIINEAYAVLSDPARRKAHDEWIAAQRYGEDASRQAQREAEQRRQAEEQAAREAQQAEQRRQAEERAAREAQQAEQRRQAEEQTAREAQQAEQRSRAHSSSRWLHYIFGIPLVFLGVYGLFIFIMSITDPELPSRYEVHGSNGDIIYDITTRLEWQRCSLGQTWNGRTCTGEANRYTWDEARAAAARVSGWRLPTIEELRTLVYCSSGQPANFTNARGRCSGNYQQPTIVTEAFPQTPSSFFWSASPASPDAGASDFAWYVFFTFGLDGWSYKSSYGRVRLVRGGQ